MLIRLSNWLADRCAYAAALFEEMERRLRICPSCGRNEYYSPPCQTIPSPSIMDEEEYNRQYRFYHPNEM